MLLSMIKADLRPIIFLNTPPLPRTVKGEDLCSPQYPGHTHVSLSPLLWGGGYANLLGRLLLPVRQTWLVCIESERSQVAMQRKTSGWPCSGMEMWRHLPVRHLPCGRVTCKISVYASVYLDCPVGFCVLWFVRSMNKIDSGFWGFGMYINAITSPVGGVPTKLRFSVSWGELLTLSYDPAIKV